MSESIHVSLAQMTSVINALAQKIADKHYALSSDLGTLAEKSEVTKTELGTDLKNEIEGKANSATSLSGYGITDAYTKEQVDAKVTAVYKPAGTVTFANLPELSASVLGNVYNVSDKFTTTANFAEGAGKKIAAGTNVVVVDVDTTGESPEYKFDVFSGEIDLSGYATTDVATTSANGLMSATDKEKLDGIRLATEAEITALIDSITI